MLRSLLHDHATPTASDGTTAGLAADAGGYDRSAASSGMLTTDL